MKIKNILYKGLVAIAFSTSLYANRYKQPKKCSGEIIKSEIVDYNKDGKPDLYIRELDTICDKNVDLVIGNKIFLSSKKKDNLAILYSTNPYFYIIDKNHDKKFDFIYLDLNLDGKIDLKLKYEKFRIEFKKRTKKDITKYI